MLDSYFNSTNESNIIYMNLFNHNNNSADDYVQLNSCGC